MLLLFLYKRLLQNLQGNDKNDVQDTTGFAG